MKKLLVIALCIGLMWSCKKTPASKTTTRQLESMENALVGTWYLQAKSDSGFSSGLTDTTYTAFGANDYITFKNYRDVNSKSTNPLYLDCTDAVGASGSGLSGAGFHSHVPAVGTVWWYETASGKLYVDTIAYFITGVTTNSLVLKTSAAGSYTILHFHR